MASIWVTRCRCRNPIIATTRKRPTSWSGCGASMSGPPRAKPGPRGAPPWLGASRFWSAIPVLELCTSEPNTFFLKPLIALAEKKVAFSSRYFDAAALQQFDTSFPTDLESSLQLEREGPVLIDDGVMISSSFFMLEYIAEALPGASLMPSNPYDAYRARAWGQFLGAQLGSVVPVLGCAKYLAPQLKAQDRAALDLKIAAIEPVERR